MHPDRIGDFIHQPRTGHGIPDISVVVHIFKIPTEDHDPCAECIQFPHQRHIIPIAGDQHHHIEFLENGQFQRFQRKRNIHTFFHVAAHGQIVSHHTFPHEDIIKDPFIQKSLPRFCLHGRKSAAEIMAIHDLTQ